MPRITAAFLAALAPNLHAGFAAPSASSVERTLSAAIAYDDITDPDAPLSSTVTEANADTLGAWTAGVITDGDDIDNAFIASANASQSITLSSLNLFPDLSFTIAGTIDANADLDPGTPDDDATARAIATFTADFSLFEPYLFAFTLDALAELEGVGNAAILATLTGPSGDVFLFDQSAPDLASDGQLAPGDYTFSITVDARLDAPTDITSSAAADANFDLTLLRVPAPSALTLLACAPLAIRRRR